MDIFINNKKFAIDDNDSDMPLLWVIRDIIGLKGTKFGCGIGVCGSCTVLVNGRAVKSCLYTAQDAVGKQITTIETVFDSPFNALQQAWVDYQVPQCGYCQSGQIMAAISLLSRNDSPDDAEIKKAMSAVLCRCGTYPRILQAIKSFISENKKLS